MKLSNTIHYFDHAKGKENENCVQCKNLFKWLPTRKLEKQAAYIGGKLSTCLKTKDDTGKEKIAVTLLRKNENH